MFCYFCGKENNDEQRFCKYCGKPLHPSMDAEPAKKEQRVPETQSAPVSRSMPGMTRMPNVDDKNRDSKSEKRPLIIVLIVLLSLIVIVAAFAVAVYLVRTGRDKKEDDKINTTDKVINDTDASVSSNILESENEEKTADEGYKDIRESEEYTSDKDDDTEELTDDANWQAAFRQILSEYKNGDPESNEPAYDYYIYDIDKDDIPELIYEFGEYEASFFGIVFSYDMESGKANRVGEMGMGHTSLYTYPEGNGIICSMSHMDGQIITKVSLENGGIVEQELFSEEVDGANGEWYTDVDDIVKDSLLLKSTDPSDDSALMGFREHSTEVVSMKNKEIHSYEVYTENITWEEARERCKNMGGYLVRIDTPEENEIVSNLLISKGVEGVAYIGGTRTPDDFEYHWIDNDGKLSDYDISYAEYQKFWLEDEPSYSDEVDGKTIEEYYVAMVYLESEGKWFWNDVNNDVLSLSTKKYSGKISFICEKE